MTNAVGAAASQKAAVAHFWKRLIVFTLPFALAFLTFTGLLIYSGESMPLALVVSMQMGDAPVLYRPDRGFRLLTYKRMSVDARRPDVIVLGSSRVMAFRSMFFNRRAALAYNAGLSGKKLESMELFLYSIAPDALPDLLLLGLDQTWFNDASNPDEDENGPEVNDLQTIFRVNRSEMQRLIGGDDLDLSAMLARRDPITGALALGRSAILDGEGFRNDGSLQKESLDDPQYRQEKRAENLEDLNDNDYPYDEGDIVSVTALAQVERMLQYSQQRQIEVIGFTLPYMPSIYQGVQADDKLGYVHKLPASLKALFSRYGARYFDFSDGAALGATDADFFDGWHASEQVDLRLYLRMLEALPEQLGPYSDPDYLQQVDAQATNSFTVFGNQFMP